MKRFSGAALGFALLFPASVTAQVTARYAFSRAQLGTRVNIVVYAADSAHAEAGAADAFARIDSLNARLSHYVSDSELAHLSSTAGTGQAVPVSSDLWTVLSAAQCMAQDTGGRFDPTLGPLTRLWRWAARRSTVPPAEERQAALSRVGYRHLTLDSTRRTATLAKPGMQLDLGGIAKGFAADEALKVLQSHGLPSAVVDAGGDMALGDAPAHTAGWPVQVGPADTVELAACGTATSGAEFRHIVHEGVRYSHILNPRTGIGLTHHRTVTVVAPTAMEADALASASSVMSDAVLADYAAKRPDRICLVAHGANASEVARCLASCAAGRVGIVVW